jgi:hypothetical protein
MRGLTSAEFDVLTNSKHAADPPCLRGGSCAREDYDWEDEDEKNSLDASLVARGLMFLFECEDAWHYRNTAMGDLLVSIVRSDLTP